MALRAHRVEPEEPDAIAGKPFSSDYADSFELTPVDARTAEQWARAMLEESPLALRTFINFGWRLVLRLQLGPTRSEDLIAGWTILLRTPEAVVLGVESRVIGHARLTFRCSHTSATASTDIAFERRGGRALWSAISWLHRQILPYLLTHAASSPGRTP